MNRPVFTAVRPLVARAVVLALLLAMAGAAEACPGCKDSVSDAALSADGGPTPGLPSGFNYSIYVMLAGLFSVMGLVASIVVKGIRAADRTAPPPGGFPVSHHPQAH